MEITSPPISDRRADFDWAAFRADIDFWPGVAIWAGHRRLPQAPRRSRRGRLFRDEAYRPYEIGKIEDVSYFQSCATRSAIGLTAASSWKGERDLVGEMPADYRAAVAAAPPGRMPLRLLQHHRSMSNIFPKAYADVLASLP